MSDPIGPLVVALDYSSSEKALELADKLDPKEVRLKVGKQLFTAAGPLLVKNLVDRGFNVFLDLKFHDIPNTVALAVEAAADLGIWMVNVHASGGIRMMHAAREALEKKRDRPLLIGVTVLTSMDAHDFADLNWDEKPIDRVSHLAKLSETTGLDGVVCSALEAPFLKKERRSGFLLVTPGVRLLGESEGDQRRVVTPQEALANGASHIVMGRSITRADCPQEKVAQIKAELGI